MKKTNLDYTSIPLAYILRAGHMINTHTPSYLDVNRDEEYLIEHLYDEDKYKLTVNTNYTKGNGATEKNMWISRKIAALTTEVEKLYRTKLAIEAEIEVLHVAINCGVESDGYRDAVATLPNAETSLKNVKDSIAALEPEISKLTLSISDAVSIQLQYTFSVDDILLQP